MSSALPMIAACASVQARGIRLVACADCGAATADAFRTDGLPVVCIVCKIRRDDAAEARFAEYLAGRSA